MTLVLALAACDTGDEGGPGTDGGFPGTGGVTSGQGGAPPPPSATGGRTGRGGRSGSGGTNIPATGGTNTPATGGTNTPASGGTNTPATGGTNAPSTGDCSVTHEGATGSEPGGRIPVCCTPTASEKTAIAEVFRLLNQHRAANGRAALAYDDKLEAAIQGHCRHMAAHSFFDHEAPEASVAAFDQRARLCGSTASGENIAYNQPDPADVMRTWINSPGHNNNMLGASYTRVGICYASRRWGQIFGR